MGIMMLVSKFLESLWQILDQVTGDDALFSELAGGDITGQTIFVDGGASVKAHP